MNKIFIFLLLFSNGVFAQKDCEIDFEEKNDSTYIKKTTETLIYEKVFGETKEMFFFSLINNDGILYLNMQIIQKSNDFLPAICFDKNSKIILQLENGKFVTLKNNNTEICSSLSYDETSKSNIRVVSTYFVFLNENYNELKKSPISLMRIKPVGDSKDIILKTELESELFKDKSNPTKYFMDYLHCVE